MASLRMLLYIVTLTYMLKVNICNANILETVRASEKRSKITLIKIDARHRIGPLRILYCMTFTYIFKIKHVKRWYLWNYESERKNAENNSIDTDIRHWVGQRRTLNTVTSDLNFQVQTFQTLTSLKRWCSARLSQRLAFSTGRHHSECCTPWSWT